MVYYYQEYLIQWWSKVMVLVAVHSVDCVVFFFYVDVLCLMYFSFYYSFLHFFPIYLSLQDTRSQDLGNGDQRLLFLLLFIELIVMLYFFCPFSCECGRLDLFIYLYLFFHFPYDCTICYLMLHKFRAYYIQTVILVFLCWVHSSRCLLDFHIHKYFQYSFVGCIMYEVFFRFLYKHFKVMSIMYFQFIFL